MLAVLFSSLTPATVSPVFSELFLIFVGNSTSFGSKNLRLLCVVSAVLLLSPTPATVTFESKNLRLLCVVFTVLLLSLTPATGSLFRRQGR